MVNLKNAITFGLLLATASAASVHKDKRHVHHRRHNKKPCSASVTGPYPVGNSTEPAGTGVAATTSSTDVAASSTPSVVTISVVPVPVNPSPSGTVQASSQPTGGSAPSSVVVPPPADSSCGVATAYVTVQQTVTVTAGQVPDTTSSTSTTLSISSSSSSVPPPPPAVSTSSSTTSVAPASTPSAPAMLQTGPTDTPAPATSSSAAPVSTPSSSQSSSGGGYGGPKMGLSWIPGVALSSLGISDVSWAYDWGQIADGVPSNIQYIPTLHDASKCAGFADQLASQPSVTFVKHFNEPDETGGGGSGLSVGEAASLHKQYIAPLAGKYDIGLPAVTSNNIPGVSGTGWLEAFVAQTGCDDFKFADFHFYGANEAVEQQAEIFLGYVDNWIQVVDNICPGRNLPIWITEFSAGPTLGDVGQAAAFMAVAGPKLEQNERVFRYAYFFPSNNELSNAISSINTALIGGA